MIKSIIVRKSNLTTRGCCWTQKNTVGVVKTKGRIIGVFVPFIMRFYSRFWMKVNTKNSTIVVLHERMMLIPIWGDFKRSLFF